MSAASPVHAEPSDEDFQDEDLDWLMDTVGSTPRRPRLPWTTPEFIEAAGDWSDELKESFAHFYGFAADDRFENVRLGVRERGWEVEFTINNYEDEVVSKLFWCNNDAPTDVFFNADGRKESRKVGDDLFWTPLFDAMAPAEVKNAGNATVFRLAT